MIDRGDVDVDVDVEEGDADVVKVSRGFVIDRGDVDVDVEDVGRNLFVLLGIDCEGAGVIGMGVSNASSLVRFRGVGLASSSKTVVVICCPRSTSLALMTVVRGDILSGLEGMPF